MHVANYGTAVEGELRSRVRINGDKRNADVDLCVMLSSKLLLLSFPCQAREVFRSVVVYLCSEVMYFNVVFPR